MSEKQPRCVMCKSRIQDGEEYFFDEDHEKVICEDCIFEYIEAEYSIDQVLLGGLDIQKRVCPEMKADDTQEGSVAPIDGQMDIFGGVYRDEQMRDEP